MIEVEGLTKRYGERTAINGLTFQANKGEVVGFLGPNGAGKTTTMRILTGYMPATEGKAVVAGFDVFDQPIEAKRRTGYLPETPPLYPDMSVSEYLDFVAKIKGVPSADRRARVQYVMGRTRIAVLAQSEEFRHGDPADRLIAATAIAHGAPLVTADAKLRRVKGLRVIW